MKSLHKGGKVTKSHTTYITAAKNLLFAAKDLPQIKKISLGIIKVTKCTPGIKITEDSPGVMRLTIRSNSAIQTIWVYLQHPDDFTNVKDLLTRSHSSS
jgi:hypothetical protein